MATYDGPERIWRLLDRVEPRMRARFVAIVGQMRDSLTLSQLEDLLARGQYQAALALLQMRALALGVLWTESFVIAGQSTAGVLSSAGIEVVFDQVNTRAVQAMQNNQLRLVREFSAEQTRATREALLDGITQGANPIEQARNFRDSIGLTQYQQRAVQNYRRALQQGSPEALQRALRDRRFDGSARRAIDGQNLTSAQVDKMVDAYRRRMIAYRARVIARTEALRSVHEGAAEGYRQAIEGGHIEANQLEQTWNTAGDSRVRDTHATMNQQVQPYGVPFVSGAGAQLRYPGDPNAGPAESIQCRCAVGTRLLSPAESAARGPVGPVIVDVVG